MRILAQLINPTLVNRKKLICEEKRIGRSRAVSLIQLYRPDLSEASGMPGVGGSRRCSHDALTAKVVIGIRPLPI